MSNIRLIGKKGSNACSIIVKESDIFRYKGKKFKTDALINYGLSGDRLEKYYKLYPSARNIHTINRNIGHSKFNVIKQAENIKIIVPKTKQSLLKSDNINDWIEKKVNSIGGIGIRKAKHKQSIPGKYYQRYIKNRTFELRVHAFKWTSDWDVQKRFGDSNEIAWNFKNGGYFQTVHNPQSYRIFREAISVSDKILDILHMSFGAVDFIVNEDSVLYFIEINSAPGFQELSKHIYIDAFVGLKHMNSKDILKLR